MTKRVVNCLEGGAHGTRMGGIGKSVYHGLACSVREVELSWCTIYYISRNDAVNLLAEWLDGDCKN